MRTGILIQSESVHWKIPGNLWNQGAEALEDADDALNDASDEA